MGKGTCTSFGEIQEARDVIGKTNLESLLSTRETIDVELKDLMDERTEPD